METLVITLAVIGILFILTGILLLIVSRRMMRKQSEEVQRTYLVFYKGDNGPEKIYVDAYDFQDAVEASLIDEKNITSIHIHVPNYPDVQGSPVNY